MQEKKRKEKKRKEKKENAVSFTGAIVPFCLFHEPALVKHRSFSLAGEETDVRENGRAFSFFFFFSPATRRKYHARGPRAPASPQRATPARKTAVLVRVSLCFSRAGLGKTIGCIAYENDTKKTFFAPPPQRGRQPAEKRSLFSQLFLCSSRACLGKCSVFQYKIAPQKRGFPHPALNRVVQLDVLRNVQDRARPVEKGCLLFWESFFFGVVPMFVPSLSW